MFQKMLQVGGSGGSRDNRYFIINEDGFQNGFSLGQLVTAGGINPQYGWTYSNNEIYAELHGARTNNSIMLNGKVENNNFNSVIVEYSYNNNKIIRRIDAQNLDLDVNKYIGLFLTHGEYFGISTCPTEIPSTDLNNLPNITIFIENSTLTGDKTITIHRLWLE